MYCEYLCIVSETIYSFWPIGFFVEIHPLYIGDVLLRNVLRNKHVDITIRDT